MVPARNLQPPLLRDAHATPCAAAAAAGLGVTPTAASSHMAQEPIDKHHSEPSTKPPPPPPPQERQQQQQQADDQHTRHAHAHREQQQQLTLRPLQPAGSSHQEAAGTSGSSSGGSSGNGGAGDWLRLGLAPASPSAATHPGVAFAADRAAGPPSPLLLSSSEPQRPPPPPPLLSSQRPPGMGFPPGPFLHQAAHGIPQASIALPVPRAGPPWLPPWSPSAVAPPPPPSLIPFGFGHGAFYTPGAGSGLDAIRVVLPPSAAGVWFALQAAPHQGREPFLPQIPRSYLRIKDGRVTVRLLIKYLAGKLGLEDESEVRFIRILHHNSNLLP
ncbi:hypothetical protein BDA96_06G063700 [Sorghum bicolor]|uniref:Uncharacterized protein n=1 Tax=Sorghum bicolor TaxID=4558 RepID=A0A921UBH5_SORBI|nr:hypothetical protein BDA96_06G063700 [Sorghum bicolor]